MIGKIIIFSLFVYSIIFIAVFLSRFSYFRNRKLGQAALKQNPNFIAGTINDWQCKLAPFEFTYGNNRSYVENLFTLYFFYLVKQDIIVIVSADEFYIDDFKITTDYCRLMCDFIIDNSSTSDGRMFITILAKYIHDNDLAFQKFISQFRTSINNSVRSKLSRSEYARYENEQQQCSYAITCAGSKSVLVDIALLYESQFNEKYLLSAYRRPAYIYKEGFVNDGYSGAEHRSNRDLYVKALFASEAFAAMQIKHRMEEAAFDSGD